MKISVATFRDAENTNHAQIHHRQRIMSTHSLNAPDKDYSKIAMQRDMQDSGIGVPLKTSR